MQTASLTLLYWMILMAINACTAELVIQRTSGLDPDRFVDNEGCTSGTCVELYGAEYIVPKSCQCRCSLTRPTFSVQRMQCVKSLFDCKNLTLSDKNGEDHAVFTVLVSESLYITPTLSVKEQLTGQSLTQVLNCPNPIVTSISYESTDGYVDLESPSLLAVTDARTNSTYLKFVQVRDNHTRTDISGLLLNVKFQCNSQANNPSACLPLKIHGFHKVARDKHTLSVKETATTEALRRLPTSVPYIIGGVVLVIVVTSLVIAIAIAISNNRVSTKKAATMEVKRVQRQWSINSTRKKPIHRIFRGLSLGDLKDKNFTYKNEKRNKGSTSSALSTMSGDSGRGKSRSPSTGNAGFDNQAVSDAILEYQSQQANNLKEGHHQPQLFKTHQAKLSTAGQGISSVPANTHRQKPSAKKLSPLKRLFSRRKNLGSETSGSRLSIDYEHFSIAQVQGKRFSDAHVNPDISFNTEGKLAQAEEVLIDVPTQCINFVENDLYQSHSYSSSQLRQMEATYNLDVDSNIPVTCIDDVADESSSDYEVNVTDVINDFSA